MRARVEVKINRGGNLVIGRWEETNAESVEKFEDGLLELISKGSAISVTSEKGSKTIVPHHMIEFIRILVD